MTQIVCRHGCPSAIICDITTYYVAGELPKLCKTLGIKLVPLTAYHRKIKLVPLLFLRLTLCGFEANMPGPLPIALNNSDIKNEFQISLNSDCADVFQKFIQTYQY